MCIFTHSLCNWENQGLKWGIHTRVDWKVISSLSNTCRCCPRMEGDSFPRYPQVPRHRTSKISCRDKRWPLSGKNWRFIVSSCSIFLIFSTWTIWNCKPMLNRESFRITFKRYTANSSKSRVKNWKTTRHSCKIRCNKQPMKSKTKLLSLRDNRPPKTLLYPKPTRLTTMHSAHIPTTVLKASTQTPKKVLISKQQGEQVEPPIRLQMFQQHKMMEPRRWPAINRKVACCRTCHSRKSWVWIPRRGLEARVQAQGQEEDRARS